MIGTNLSGAFYCSREALERFTRQVADEVRTSGVRRALEPMGAPDRKVVHDTVNVVRFVFVGQAKTVSLVGDFNAWGAQPVSLVPTGTAGTWTASVPLPSGRHEYAFIVDGQRWVADPFAPTSSDEFNTSSSIITVGS